MFSLELQLLFADVLFLMLWTMTVTLSRINLIPIQGCLLHSEMSTFLFRSIFILFDVTIIVFRITV